MKICQMNLTKLILKMEVSMNKAEAMILETRLILKVIQIVKQVFNLVKAVLSAINLKPLPKAKIMTVRVEMMRVQIRNTKPIRSEE